jgi:ribosomal protein S18 acetylase RimI-like enzyme
MRKESLKSVEVTSENEVLFYNHIKDNFHGMLLSWKDRRIQLRGSPESLELLLKDKTYTPISITGFEEHKELIATHFSEYTREIGLYRMDMRRTQHKSREKYEFTVLSQEYKADIANLMRTTDPVYWGSRKPEDILIDENNIFYGIFDQNQIVCITSLWNYEEVGYITIVGTHPDYWNKGYASSLVSSVLKILFQDKKQCLITVRVDNPPAIHVYEKLGFKICNTQYSYEKKNE